MSIKKNKIEDTLSRRLFAGKIASEIENTYLDPDKNKIIFAISGKWGTGKTRILELIEDILSKKDFSIIWFNPWKYSQEDISLKRAFLKQVKKSLNSSVDLNDLYFDQTKTEINWDFLKKLTITSLIIGFLILMIRGVQDFISLKNFFLTPIGNIVLITLLIPIFLKTFFTNKSSSKISTAEEFEEKFNQLVANNKKVMIFIDDLDRCTPKTVKTILDSLRTFFYHPHCSYVITGDHTVVERYAGEDLHVQPIFRLEDKNNPDSRKIVDEEATAKAQIQEGRRFLKKLFDVYWQIPMPTPAKFKEFVEREIGKSDTSFPTGDRDELKSMLIDDRYFERNPRHVVRFLTALRFSLESVQQKLKETEDLLSKQEEISSEEIQNLKIDKERMEDIVKRPALLAKVLLVQELFYPLYEELSRSPSEIINHERSLRKNQPIHQAIINGKRLDEIFIDKKEIDTYISIINIPPQFTDENDSIRYEAASFFSFSGFTGLPSTIGPDESKFLEYLKTGQLATKLIESLRTTPTERNKKLIENALNAFNSSQDENEKINIILESLKASAEIDDWSYELPQLKEKIYSLSSDGQNRTKNNFIQAVLTKRPDLLDTINTEKPEFINEVWITLDNVKSFEKFHKDTKEKITKLIVNSLDISPPQLKPAELLLQILNETDPQVAPIIVKIKTNLKDLEATKNYLDYLKQQGLSKDSKIYSIIKEQLEGLISQDTNNVYWLVQNETILSEFELFDSLRNKVLDLKDQPEFFKKIIQYLQQLKLSEEQKSQLFDSLIEIIKKSSDLSILIDEFVRGFIVDKEQKKKIFRVLVEITRDNNEKIVKRELTIDLLKQENQLWIELTKEDIGDLLKLLKQLKISKLRELNKKRREVLDSWNYEENKK